MFLLAALGAPSSLVFIVSIVGSSSPFSLVGALTSSAVLPLRFVPTSHGVVCNVVFLLTGVGGLGEWPPPHVVPCLVVVWVAALPLEFGLAPCVTDGCFDFWCLVCGSSAASGWGWGVLLLPFALLFSWGERRSCPY